MATSNKNPSFDWLRQECLQIKSRRFHIFESLTPDDYSYECAGHRIDLNGDYSDFLREFGWANFFTDEGDAPAMAVYPLKENRRYLCEDGRVYVEFAYRGGKSFYFDESAIVLGDQSRVYLVKGKSVIEENSDFTDWLRSSMNC